MPIYIIEWFDGNEWVEVDEAMSYEEAEYLYREYCLAFHSLAVRIKGAKAA